MDNYAWLRDPNWPEVADEKILSFLKKENQLAEDYLNNLKPLTEKFYSELRGRVTEDDTSVPVLKDGYLYWSYINQGQNYHIYAREKNAVKEILLDKNILAQDKGYLAVGVLAVSDDNQYLLYSYDNNGSESYKVAIKDIKKDLIIEDNFSNICGNIVWDGKSQGFYYTPRNENLRPSEVRYHKIGDNQANDELLYSETDPTFWVSIDRSASKKHMFITTGTFAEDEIHYLAFDSEYNTPQLFAERQEGRKINIDHFDDKFYLKLNDTGSNFRLCMAGEDNIANWIELFPESEKIALEDFYLYQNNIVLEIKENGLTHIKIYDYDMNLLKDVNFAAPSYAASIQYTTYEDPNLRYYYSAFNQPYQIVDLSFEDFSSTVRKEQQIPSGFDTSEYTVERVWATARDGVEIPISLVYKNDLFKADGSNPLYLYGYGCYGLTIPASFNGSIISLLERGFVYALAHIRGGGDLGSSWHDQAKLLTKKVTYYDFIDCAEYLISEEYSSKQNIVISGASAGGTLVGFCANERPDLFKAVVAKVPSVDVLDRMLDDSAPGTPVHYSEVGNPHDQVYYDYIKSYSPFDNISAHDYPHIYVTAGLSDPRVVYWEPAKWVAKLRDNKTDDNDLLLKINMQSGHFGESGRFEYLYDTAEEYSFVYNALVGQLQDSVNEI